MHIPVKVIPSSSRDKVCGWYGEQLKVKVQAPPEGGKANKAVIDLLSKTFGVKKSEVQILSGATSADKIVDVASLSDHELKAMDL